ncbi:DUF5694 domain-containing protein [Deinococcus aerophilus]|uniref:TraB/GumN family protein n=1 Tax=Deinococcus aerophilus TaxID=522488 RepID=A0ABQ2GKL7_9DEIO|nr:DUF5694 domain-containing protein [Deinococcus aerophilus]GGM00184.1 hypothetical protein GCM10010841_05930 [Deinococcus aerophilus]
MPHAFSGPPTEVLVLGSAHLDHQTTDAALQPTLARLLAWHPQAVAVELLPGDVVQAYRQEGDLYADLRVGGYATALRLDAAARKYCSWSRDEAEARALHPGTPPAERVLAWLVALEPVSALLTWTPDLPLPPDVAARLAEYAGHTGETHRLAVPLARRLGHVRLHHFDDFTTNRPLQQRLSAVPQLWEDDKFRAEIYSAPAMLEGGERMRQAQANQDYWEYLSYANSSRCVQDSEALEVGSYLNHPLLTGEHRTQVADWNARNIFMAARLRQLTALHPAGRVLAIVGAAHKGPLEAVLSAISPDLRLVELSELDMPS